jgi:myosin-18
LQVEEDDVERANPPGFDKIENLAQLRYLNESSVLHTLRQRYSNNLINTFAGPTIIAINPMVPLGIYSDKARIYFAFMLILLRLNCCCGL